MNVDYLNYLKEKKEIVSVALLGISAFLGVLLLVKVASFFVASARAEGVVRKAIAQNNANAKDTEKFFAKSKAIADQLKRKNLFAPPPPKQHPVSAVTGILGSEALINGKWYAVGDKIGDAKIVAISPVDVKIEWEGNNKVFTPILASVPSTASGPRPPKGTAKAEGSRPGRAEMVAVGGERRPGFGREGRRPFGNLSDEERARMREGFMRMRARFENMSEAERDRLRREMQERRERFMNMSPEERREFVERMRERFGGGRPGGRGPRGRDRR